VEPVANHTALRSLYLDGTQVTDVSALDHLEMLEIIAGPAPREGNRRPGKENEA